MAELDWEATALGSPDSWPQSLRHAVRMLLTSRHAMWVGWGPDLVFLYNDAYKPTLGVKHPAALGWPIQQVWSEIWPDIGPRIQTVMETGTATWDENLLLVLERSGYLEETYHTFSYSPLTEDDGSVSGTLCVVTEETERVLGERRLASLQELSSALATTKTEGDTLAAIEGTLARRSKDLPFTLTYLFKNAGTSASLVARTGIPLDHPVAPRLIEIGAKDQVWPGDALLQGNAPVLVYDLSARFDDSLRGAWKKTPRQALLVPIAQQGETQPAGFLVAGLNPFRRLDEAYTGFLQLIAGQLGASLVNVRAAEEQRRLQEVSTRLVAANNGTSLLQEIVDAAIAITDADMGHIQLLGRDDGALEIVAHRGFERPFLDFFNAVHDGQAACGSAMQQGTRVVIEDVQSSPVFVGTPALEVMLAARALAVQCTPLVSRSGRLVGMLSTHYHTPRRITGRDLRVLDQLARQAADWIERTQLDEAGHRLERERDEVLARLQLQFERMPIACAVFDPQGCVIEWNPAAETTFGYGRDEVIGRKGPLLILPTALRPQLQELIERLASGDMSAHSVNENLTKDGHTIVCEWRNTPLHDAAGEVIGILSMAQDITERVRAQETLDEINRRLELALKGSDIGVWELELPNGQFETARVLYTNVLEQLGYPRPESTPDLAVTLSLVHPEDRKWLPDAYQSYLAGETELLEFEHRLRHSDGSYHTMLVRGIATRDAAGKPTRIIGSRVDITERKRAEEALRWSEERYRALISKVRDFAIFSTDEIGVVTTWNEGCQDVLGYGPEEFVGLDSADLFTPEDRDERVPVAERRQSIHSGTAVIDRWMIAKGGRRFFAMGAIAPLKDSADSVIGFSCVVRDVTPMKESQDRLAQRGESLERLVSERTGELEETTGRLRISERMAALGTLAAGLGHDMGNLLLPMDVRLDLLIEANLPQELHEHVVGIQKCARYLQRLSSGLRLLATDPAHVESRGATDLDRWWKDVRIILKDVLPGGVRFEDHLPESESWVALGRTALTQAVYNLVQNAADAVKEHGGTRVSVTAENDPTVSWIAIRVTDDGPGMTEEVARRCMEPYFSTKSRGESTGMGLSLVHALVTGAGGHVKIQSAPGQGTTISLILPRALPKEQTPDASPDLVEAV